MQIGRRRFIRGAALTALGIASGIGIDELVRKHSPPSSTPAETPPQPDSQALEQAIIRYNSASIQEKGRILSDMYDGRAKLVAVPYDGYHNHIVSRLKDETQDVAASMPHGVIHVNVLDSASASNFSLSNARENVTVDNQGRLRLYDGPLSGSGYRSIAIPKSHSLLIAENGIHPKDINKLVNGLRHFGREYGLFDISKSYIIRDALRGM